MNKLNQLRKQVDRVDNKIVILLNKRIKIVKKVGEYKKVNNLQIIDKKRWQVIIRSKKGYLKKIWGIIHEEALKIEKAI